MKPLFAFIGLTICIGAGHGMWTDRWSQSDDLKRHLALLEKVPINFGDWQGENAPYESEDMARAGIKGCIVRRYKNERTGSTVSLLIVCGRGGPICVHTPDICYAGAGYRQVAAQEKIKGEQKSIDVWRADFEMPRSVINKRLEISWTWSRDGKTWSAPDNPRITFARYPSLYKMYVVHEKSIASTINDDTSTEFLARLLPELQNSLSE